MHNSKSSDKKRGLQALDPIVFVESECNIQDIIEFALQTTLLKIPKNSQQCSDFVIDK